MHELLPSAAACTLLTVLLQIRREAVEVSRKELVLYINKLLDAIKLQIQVNSQLFDSATKQTTG